MNPFVEAVQACGSPIIEGERVTFVWKGTNPPQLMGDFSDWERGEHLNLENGGENVWYRSMQFPLDTYMEYVFVRDGRRVFDPYNHRLTPNGYGRYNHYFCLPEYKPTTLANRRQDVPAGRVTQYLLPTWELIGGRKRRVHLYSPAVQVPTPLLVVLDGQDYLRRARLPVILDNLIAQQRIMPVSLALVESEPVTRVVEYGCSEGNLIFLTQVVLPLARKNLNLIDLSIIPGAYGILGASMGGLMALYAGLRLPEVFGKVLAQSGGFMIADREVVVFDLVRYGAIKSLKIWMEVGTYDFQTLLDANRRMQQLLQERGYDFVYHEYNAGHNYPAWRDRIDRGLVHLFGKNSPL